eukprot:14647222-Alexandrium_andersonii.AAC.1
MSVEISKFCNDTALGAGALRAEVAYSRRGLRQQPPRAADPRRGRELRPLPQEGPPRAPVLRRALRVVRWAAPPGTDA